MIEILFKILLEILLQIFLFIAIFAESIPFIGTFVPGGVFILFFAGMFASQGKINLIFTIITAITASLSVGIASYHLGKYHGNEIIEKYSKYLLLKRGFVHHICDIVKEHPVKAILFGKFSPATRCMMPFISGIKGVDFDRYLITDIFATIIWALFFVLFGYYVNEGLKTLVILQRGIFYSTLVIFVLAYIVYLAIHFGRKIKAGHKLF